MVGTTAPRQHADPRGRPRRSRLLILLLIGAAVLLLAGCGDEETATDDSSTTTASTVGTTSSTAAATTTTAAVATTTSGDTAEPTASGPTQPEPTTATGLTIEDLEQALLAQYSANPQVGPGQISCEGSGPLSDWQAIRCSYLPDQPIEFGPIYVSVFDGGRYGKVVGACCDGEPEPSAYPAGLYCRDVYQPPPDSNDERDFYHLSYGAAVYYWMNEGRPSRMDADNDGEPCETVYPADEVARYWSSVRVLEPAS